MMIRGHPYRPPFTGTSAPLPGRGTGSNRAKTLDFNSMAEAMADELQHRGQDPSEIGNWTWDPPQ